MIRPAPQQAKPRSPPCRRRDARRYPWNVAIVVALGVLLAACSPNSAAGPGQSAQAPSRPPQVTLAPPHFSAHAFVTADGVSLPLRRWLPARQPRAVILALHGFGDYSHAFAMPAKAWATQGIATYAYDQRGFGAAPRPGIWPGEGALAVDAIVASRILRRMYPDTPLYLLGESMGGAVAVLAASGAMHGVAPGPRGMPAADVDGIILSSPAIWGRATMDLLPKLALFFGVRLFPDVVVTGSSLHILASDNLPMLRALGRDPLMLKGVRIATVYGLVDLMDDALAAAPRLRVPTMLMYGAHDEIVPRNAMADFAAHLPRTGAERDRLAYYRGGYHLLLRDLDGDMVADDVASWIFNRRAPLPSQADAAEAVTPWPPKPSSNAAAAMPLASAEARR